MIRLFLLIAATLIVLLLLLAGFGGPGARQVVQPRTPPAPVATSEAPPAADDAMTAAQPPADLVQASTQTPLQLQRFPGPPLKPSPEYADRTPLSAAIPATDDGPLARITGSRVNMRSGPSTSDPVLTALSAGTLVVPLGPIDAAWVQIRTPDGQIGYVAGQFLSAH